MEKDIGPILTIKCQILNTPERSTIMTPENLLLLLQLSPTRSQLHIILEAYLQSPHSTKLKKFNSCQFFRVIAKYCPL